jgi:outer membrane receptor protein involved in Fe transport
MELSGSFDWFRDGTLTTQLGGTGMVNVLDLATRPADPDTGAPVSHGDLALDGYTAVAGAVSAEQVWRPARWLALDAGARVDRDERFAAQASPRLAATVHPWSGGVVKAIYTRAFRAPSYNEVSGHSPILIQALHLRPENVESVEIVAEQRVETQRVSLAFFDTHYDAIVASERLDVEEVAGAVARGLTPIPFSPTLVLNQLRNGPTARTTGFTATLDSVLMGGRLRLGASFTGTNARQSGEPIAVAPRALGTARASYDIGGMWPTIAFASTFASKALFNLAYQTNFQPSPYAPPQLELRGTMTGGVPRVRGLSYRVIVSHSFHDRTAYAVGAVVSPFPTARQPELSPLQQWNATLGLQYDF